MSMLLTDSTVQKLHELQLSADNPDLNLRVYVEGGGCSGLQYRFTFDEEIAADDVIVKKNAVTATESSFEVKLLVDPISFQYLRNAEIDYKKDLQGERFIIRNPNAKTTCGCGSSFSVDDKQEKENQ